MLFFARFIVFSTLIIVATPFPVYHRPTGVDSNFRSTLYRRSPPKFEIGPSLVPPTQRKDTLEKMMEHYETKATDAQKGARLARVASRWNRHLLGRECMTFEYHAGETKNSPVIGPTVKIYRNKPVPEMHFIGVPKEHQEDMQAASANQYNNLGLYSAASVKSMKAWGDWHLNGGIREQTKLTFHSTTKPNTDNTIGDPMIIHRPLTLHILDGSPSDRYTIGESVRAAHTMMVADPRHPARTSNYGIVHSNWHDSLPDADGKTYEQIVVGLEEVSEVKRQRKHFGNYAIRKGTSEYELSNADSLTLHTGTSHTGPSGSNNEVVRPSGDQKHQHLYVPLTHALPFNPGPSRTNDQGPSQFNAGSPSSRHGPPPQQLLQPHVGSPALHNEFYMPSPEVWRPWDPLSQPSHDTWQSSQPDLYSDRLWHAESPLPSSNTQIPPHPGSLSSQPSVSSPGPSSHLGLSHPKLLHPVSPEQPHSNSPSSPAQSNSAVLPSQQSPQVGPSSNPGGSPHSNQPDDELSPEIWHILNSDPVYPYPWNPHQRSP